MVARAIGPEAAERLRYDDAGRLKSITDASTNVSTTYTYDVDGNRYIDTVIRGYDHIEAGDYVLLSVEDQGTGIPADDLEHIFEPFYRVQESRDRGSGGHGLGLSIAATAVRRHGGDIRASNAPDGGLVVEISLPSAPA